MRPGTITPRSHLTAVTLALLALTATTAGAVAAQGATFSGSNGVIAFSEFADGVPGTQIMTVDPATSHEVTISKKHYGDDEPAFSPDGKTVLFRNDGDIWTMTASGGSRHDLTPGNHGSYDTPSWSPDGSQIAFADNGQIATMRADGTHIKVLTTKGGQTPDWSPDGTQIAFVSYNDVADIPNLFVMQPDGSHKTNLSLVTDPSDAYYDENPSWSPDSSQLAVDSDRPTDGQDIGPIQAFSISRDGSTATQLTAVLDNVDGQAFSPDGLSLTYTANDNGTNQVFVQNIGSLGSDRPTTDGPDTAIGADESWQNLYTTRLKPSRSSAKPGATVTVTLTGYADGDRIQLSFRDAGTTTSLETVTADGHGRATATVTIPAAAAPGTAALTGVGAPSGRAASAPITVKNG